jgi:hypothetical protein
MSLEQVVEEVRVMIFSRIAATTDQTDGVDLAKKARRLDTSSGCCKGIIAQTHSVDTNRKSTHRVIVTLNIISNILTRPCVVSGDKTRNGKEQ